MKMVMMTMGARKANGRGDVEYFHDKRLPFVFVCMDEIYQSFQGLWVLSGTVSCARHSLRSSGNKQMMEFWGSEISWSVIACVESVGVLFPNADGILGETAPLGVP